MGKADPSYHELVCFLNKVLFRARGILKFIIDQVNSRIKYQKTDLFIIYLSFPN